MHAIIGSLARTEDVKFSPSGRRLAIASFARNRIAVFDIDIATTPASPHVHLLRAAEFGAAGINAPHGLDFLDDETLLVTNRFGDPLMFRLPPGDIAQCAAELSPVVLASASDVHGPRFSSSLAVVGTESGLSELLLCSNVGNSLTRHMLDRRSGAISRSELLVRKGLMVPDGVAISADRRWIAISNHNTSSVLVYENLPALSEHSDPDGILRGAHYPHSLRFTADGRYLLVADAGAPFVHVYASGDRGWRGVRNPVHSFEIMDEATFVRGQHNPQEGGPKGIDVDPGQNVLIATSECQPLVFLDLSALLETASRGPGAGEGALAMRYEVHLLEEMSRIWQRAKSAEVRAAKAEADRVRVQAKLKRVPKLLRRLFRRKGQGK